MKITKNNQSGFAIIELLIIVVVVAIISVVGMKLMQNKTTGTASAPASTSKTMPTKIESKDDLTQSAKVLDSTPIDTSLDPAQLDSSLNSLL